MTFPPLSLHTIKSDLDLIAGSPGAVDHINCLARAAAPPLGVFIDLGGRRFAEAMPAINTTTRDVGTGAAAVAVEGPPFVLKAIAGTPGVRAQIGVPGTLLGLEGRIKVGLPKTKGGPWRAIGVAENRSTIGSPSGAGAME
jgi:hypothetical protein